MGTTSHQSKKVRRSVFLELYTSTWDTQAMGEGFRLDDLKDPERLKFLIVKCLGCKTGYTYRLMIIYYFTRMHHITVEMSRVG